MVICWKATASLSARGNEACINSDLKRIRDAISTTTRPTIPQKLLGANFRHYNLIGLYLTLSFCVILK